MERFYLLFIFQKTKPNPNLKNELIYSRRKEEKTGIRSLSPNLYLSNT